MRFRTISGSVYELDDLNKRIRRMSGAKDPTPRQGPDGEWKTYAHLLEAPQEGKSLVIVWAVGDDTEAGPLLKTTMTSMIVEILV